MGIIKSDINFSSFWHKVNVNYETRPSQYNHTVNGPVRPYMKDTACECFQATKIPVQHRKTTTMKLILPSAS